MLLIEEDKRKFGGGRKRPSGSTDRRVVSRRGVEIGPPGGISYPKFSSLRQPGSYRWLFGSVHAASVLVFVIGVPSFSPSSPLPSLPNRGAPRRRRADVTVAGQDRARALFVSSGLP